MANYYATARSNYFAVKDEMTFRQWAEGELKGHDIRGNAYLSRFAGLLTLLDPEHKHLRQL